MKQQIKIAMTTISAILLSAVTVYAATWVDQGGRTYIQGTMVGIGTSNPDTPVHISNSSAEMLKLQNSLSNGGIYQFKVGGGGWEDGKLMMVDRANGLDASRMTIVPNGNIGIGTNNPNEKITLSSNDNIGFKTVPGQNWASRIGYADYLNSRHGFHVDGLHNGQWNNNQFVVRADSGNIGIGTFDPNEKVTITGTSNIGFRTELGQNFGIRMGYFDNLNMRHGFHIDGMNGAQWQNNQFVVRADTGNVGINTNDPLSKFHIRSTDEVGMTLENPNNAADTRVEIRNPNATTQLFTWQNLGARIGTRSSPSGAGDVFFTTDDTIQMTLKDNGNVGVGTTSPAYKFHVVSPNETGIVLENPNNGADTRIEVKNPSLGVQLFAWQNLGARIGTRYSPSGAGDVFFTTDDNIQMTIKDTGNVGIGTSNPNEKLQVQGNIKLSGNIISDGDICIGKCN